LTTSTKQKKKRAMKQNDKYDFYAILEVFIVIAISCYSPIGCCYSKSMGPLRLFSKNALN